MNANVDRGPWHRAFACAAILALAACAGVPQATAPSSPYTLRLIGEQFLTGGLSFGGTTVGGLSGIDYDPSSDLYYLISDDRSNIDPTRYYTARLAIDAEGFHDAALQTVVSLHGPDGRLYPEDAADTESIRFDPRTRSLWYTSEGMRRIGRAAADSQLVDPFVRQTGLDGRYLGTVPLDPMFRIVRDRRGPRDNLVFEGLTLSADGEALWVSMEGPLLQDGPMPTATDGAWSRISRHDRQADGGFGPLAAQFAYRIDPIPTNGAWTMSHAQTGISELLAIDATHFFVLERALTLPPKWHIRLFEADLAGANDIRTIDSLTASGAAFIPMRKTLVFDFDALGIYIDNLEGVCFGPTLANGHRTLVFVSDDNFNPGQRTQLLAFELVPRTFS